MMSERGFALTRCLRREQDVVNRVIAHSATFGD